MQRKLSDKHIAEALDAAGVSEDKRRHTINYLFGPDAHKRSKKPGDEWDKLRATLAADRRAILSNKPRWAVDLVSTYEAYLAIMDKVRERIDTAQHAHNTLAATEAHYAKLNRERASTGQAQGPSCTATWQTWVPPHIRDALAAQAAAAYAARINSRGPQFIPFVPPRMRVRADKTEHNLRMSLRRVRDDHADQPDGMASTPYRALWLCAARMAESQLEQRLKHYAAGVSPVDSPLPVNWHALLDDKMRKRLKDAVDNPAGVSPQGLGHFYSPRENPVAPSHTTE